MSTFYDYCFAAAKNDFVQAIATDEQPIDTIEGVEMVCKNYGGCRRANFSRYQCDHKCVHYKGKNYSGEEFEKIRKTLDTKANQ